LFFVFCFVFVPFAGSFVVKDETTKLVTGSLSQTAKLDENKIELIKRIDVEKRELKYKLSYSFAQ